MCKIDYDIASQFYQIMVEQLFILLLNILGNHRKAYNDWKISIVLTVNDSYGNWWVVKNCGTEIALQLYQISRCFTQINAINYFMF